MQFNVKIILAAFMATLILMTLLGWKPAGAALPHPLGCDGGSIWHDSQAWWTNADGGAGDDFGHLHTGLCFPHMARVSGVVSLRVRTVLHESPAEFRRVDVQVWQRDDADYVADTATFRRSIARCIETGGALADAGRTCIWWDTLTFDTSAARYDGWTQIRVHSTAIEPNGEKQYTSTGLQWYFANGKTVRSPVENYERNPDYQEARGWYTGARYTNARLYDPPEQPIKGLWQPRVRLFAGAGGIPVRSHRIGIDTDFHADIPGILVREGVGEFDGRLSIDTTRLTNGWHRLSLRADAPHESGSVASGVLLIFFEVQN